MKRRVRLEETSLDSRMKVDTRRGVVHDVKILGFKSTHGYSYSPAAMQKAVALYEGKAINVDHPEDRSRPGASRSYHDRFGHIEGVYFDPRSGLRGQLHYNKMHPLAKQFVFDAKHAPHRVGLSHNADAPLVKQNGQLVCPVIWKVRSVDLVADPGTTHGLFESKGDGMSKMRVPRRKRRTKLTGREKLIKLLESSSDDDPRVVALLEDAAAAAINPTAGNDLGGGISLDALKGMVVAIFDDASLNVKAKLSKLRQFMKMFSDLIPGEGVEGGAEIDAAAQETMKSKQMMGAAATGTESKDDSRLATILTRLESQLAESNRRNDVSEICEDLGFRPTRQQRSLLAGQKNRKAIKQLATVMMESQGSGVPRLGIVGGKATTSKGRGAAGATIPTELKDWARTLKSNRA